MATTTVAICEQNARKITAPGAARCQSVAKPPRPGNSLATDSYRRARACSTGRAFTQRATAQRTADARVARSSAARGISEPPPALHLAVRSGGQLSVAERG